MKRINKISVSVDEYDTIISLYKNNQIMGIIYGDDLGIKPYTECEVSMKAYQLYIKDIVINLLDNGGIDGYYYTPKSETVSKKYDNGAFSAGIKEYIQKVIDNKYKFILTTLDIQAERYKDNYIKNAEGQFAVTLIDFNIKLVVLGQIKSGQLCRPKYIRYNNDELPLNITTIRKIIKDNAN